jgi:predicted acetyltransferase
MLEIRKLAENELEAADLLWLQSFERGARSQLAGLHAYRNLFNYRIDRFGLWDSAGLQATFEMTNTHLHFGPDVVLPTGYISSIACAPASRGRGYGGAGLKHLLAHMRNAGQVVSTLAPFDFDFYRRFGWEWISPSRHYKVPAHILPSSPETEYVRAAMRDDRLQIRAMYRRLAARYRGMVARDETQWNYLLDDTTEHLTYSYVYERGGEVEGYLVLRGGSSEETCLPEFLTLTPRARRGLLGLLKRLAMQTRKFVWEAPEDDGLWSQFFHKELETTLGTYGQGRVVDVAGALAAWKPERSARGSLTLGIEDACAPWNQGTWRISFAERHVSIHPTQDEAQIRMDIQAFSQAFFGVLTVATFREQDRMLVHDEAGYHALCALLSGPPMWTDGQF